MGNRTGTYIAFHAGGTTDPTKSDIKYYNMLKMWSAHKHIEFRFVNSHDKTAAVRDSSLRATLKSRLVKRLQLSKRFLIIITETTKNDTDWVPFEIEYGIDVCELPVIAAYPEYAAITAPHQLAFLWPPALRTRIEAGRARVIHIPFKKGPLLDAVSQFSLLNKKNLIGGYNHYSQRDQVNWDCYNF